MCRVFLQLGSLAFFFFSADNPSSRSFSVVLVSTLADPNFRFLPFFEASIANLDKGIMSSGKADVEASSPSGWSSVSSGICSSSSVIDRFARLAGGLWRFEYR